MNMKKSVAKTLVVAAVAGALMVPAAATDAAENAITVTLSLIHISSPAQPGAGANGLQKRAALQQKVVK